MPAGRFCEVIESGAAGRRRLARRSRRGRWSPAALVLCAVLLSGCGAAVWEDARSETDQAAHDVSGLRDAAERPRYSAIRVIERRPWLGLARQDARQEDALPARLLEPGAVTLPLAGIGEASVLARRIEAATGIPVRFIGPAPAGEDSSRAGSGAQASAARGSPAGIGIDLLSPDGGIWTGSLDALLDAWTEPDGYAWRYDGEAGAIGIVRREAVAFRIHALAGRQRYEASGSTDDGASGGDEGGGVSTRQSIMAETDYDPWPEIEAQAAALAGPGRRPPPKRRRGRKAPRRRARARKPAPEGKRRREGTRMPPGMRKQVARRRRRRRRCPGPERCPGRGRKRPATGSRPEAPGGPRRASSGC